MACDGLKQKLLKLPAGAITFGFVWGVWIPLSSVLFGFVENWTWWEAFVFVATCVSTIGSGHIVPVTETGRLLVIPCGMIGIPLVFGAVAWVGHVTLHIMELVLKKVRGKEKEIPTALKVKVFIPFILIFFFHCVAVYVYMESWTIADASYYTFTSFTTIGFGDLTPRSSKKLDEHGCAGRCRSPRARPPCLLTCT